MTKSTPEHSAAPLRPEVVLRNYFHAKDENRPHVLARVFTPDAELLVANHSSAIAFPARTVGREAISEVLVRRFGQSYENVYSFYLQRPPPASRTFACDWLVAMSEKESKGVRVGCGRYEWVFDAERSGLASHLTITILAMQVLPPAELAPVMAWVQTLDYPWSTAGAVRRSAPGIELVACVLRHLPERASDA
jgi:hypothetical protein